MNITRRALIQNAMLGLALPPRTIAIPAQQRANDFYLQLVKANDVRIPDWLAAVAAFKPRRSAVRRLTSDLQGLTAAFCAPDERSEAFGAARDDY